MSNRSGLVAATSTGTGYRICHTSLTLPAAGLAIGESLIRRDFLGRMLGLWAFSYLAVVLVISAGYACGARFSLTVVGAWRSLGFLVLASFATAGIGMVIGTFIKRLQGAIMTGVGISVVTAAISGVMAPYSSLPKVLQTFARIYPISSAKSAVTCLVAGEDFAGHNALGASQVALTVVTSFLLFAAGLTVYSKLCWRRR